MSGADGLYLGSANTWECDEMGHMNVRFYVRRAMEGLGLFAARLGMSGAFRVDARSTLTPLDQHIRFLKEVRAGQPLSMSGGVARWDETTADIYLELRHGDGSAAAAIRTRVAHAAPRSLTPFAWSQRMQQAAAALAVSVPAHGAPRSIDIEAQPGIASVARADELGAPLVGAGVVTPDETDAFGRMRPELFIGRISDAVPHLLGPLRREVGTAGGGKKPAGGAVLEYRLVYRRWPQAGDALVIRSGIVDVGPKTHRLAHWVLDPISGEAWATAEAVAVVFDLDTRKTLTLPAAQRKALEAQIIPGMTL